MSLLHAHARMNVFCEFRAFYEVSGRFRFMPPIQMWITVCACWLSNTSFSIGLQLHQYEHTYSYSLIFSTKETNM